MIRQVISVDVDGVIADFISGFVAAINESYPGRNIPAGYQPTDWDFSEVLAKREEKLLWNNILMTPGFWRKLAPMHDNVDALKIFLQRYAERFDVYYVTSRPDCYVGTSSLMQTKLWLGMGSLLQYNTSVCVVRDPKEKIPMLRALRVTASIDDHVPNVMRAAEISGHTAYLHRHLQNKKEADILAGTAGSPVKVVENVQEFLDDLLMQMDLAEETGVA